MHVQFFNPEETIDFAPANLEVNERIVAALRMLTAGLRREQFRVGPLGMRHPRHYSPGSAVPTGLES